MPANRPPDLTPLLALLGAENVRTDDETRQQAVSGWSPRHAKRKQLGTPNLPLAVLRPGNTEEIVFLTEWCRRHGREIVPIGGVSSLRTPFETASAWVAVDTARIDALSWDEESLLVTAGAGARLGAVEETLNRHGYTLGHFPQTLSQSTVGGAVATNAIGFLSGKYGRMRDLTAAIEIVLNDGTVLRTDPAPGANAYRNSLDPIIGSEGVLGILTEATLRMRPIPEARAFAAFSFTDFDTAIDAARLVYRSDARPAALCLLDAADAALLVETDALLLMAFEGDEIVQTGNYQLAYAVCQEVGGTPLPSDIGDRWFERRQETDWIAPNGRPEAIADALAFSAIWSKLKSLNRALTSHLRPAAARMSVRLCHPTANGATLEIRFVLEAADPQTALIQHEDFLHTALSLCQTEGAYPHHHYGTFGRQETISPLWNKLLRIEPPIR